ncbi:unnamed protein product [Urochloa humidicola]
MDAGACSLGSRFRHTTALAPSLPLSSLARPVFLEYSSSYGLIFSLVAAPYSFQAGVGGVAYVRRILYFYPLYSMSLFCWKNWRDSVELRHRKSDSDSAAALRAGAASAVAPARGQAGRAGGGAAAVPFVSRKLAWVWQVPASRFARAQPVEVLRRLAEANTVELEGVRSRGECGILAGGCCWRDGRREWGDTAARADAEAEDEQSRRRHAGCAGPTKMLGIFF